MNKTRKGKNKEGIKFKRNSLSNQIKDSKEILVIFNNKEDKQKMSFKVNKILLMIKILILR